jgi:hypothetical protein
MLAVIVVGSGAGGVGQSACTNNGEVYTGLSTTVSAETGTNKCVRQGQYSIPVCMYARRIVDNPEEPLSSEQILERSTKIFRREMTAVERRSLFISNEVTLKAMANTTQPQVPKT